MPSFVHEPIHPQPLEVYPNPVSELLYIKDLPSEVAEYAIFNVMGQKVAAASTEGCIPVAELGKGVYVLQITGDKFLKTAKFVVK